MELTTPLNHGGNTMTKQERRAVLKAWDSAIHAIDTRAYDHAEEFTPNAIEEFYAVFMERVRLYLINFNGIGIGMDFIMQEPALFYGQI